MQGYLALYGHTCAYIQAHTSNTFTYTGAVEVCGCSRAGAYSTEGKLPQSGLVLVLALVL